jgi:hypothetical protein
MTEYDQIIFKLLQAFECSMRVIFTLREKTLYETSTKNVPDAVTV